MSGSYIGTTEVRAVYRYHWEGQGRISVSLGRSGSYIGTDGKVRAVYRY